MSSKHASGSEPVRAYLFAFTALMLTVACVFWQYLFSSSVLFYRDITSLHFPHAVELRTLVRAGQLPLWNPFEHFGEPVAVNLDYLLFYPTAWLAWILPAAYGFKLHYVVHFFALAAGSFLLARRIGLKPWACYTAGALFVFSGPAVSFGNFYNHLAAAAWIPFVILAADYAVARGGWRGAAVLAVSFTLQLFAGGPEMTLVTFVLALAWSLTFHHGHRLVLQRYVFAMALAAGMWAVQAVPAFWHLRYTERAARLGYDAAYFWSFHPLKLLEMIFPNFWGNPLSLEKVPWAYLEGREPFLLSVFLGILPLALAAVAVAVRNDRAGRFWAVVGLAAVIVALGHYTAASYLFYYVVPVFRVFRYPVKFLVPAALAVAQLAAMGAEWLVSDNFPHAQSLPRLRWLRAALAAFALTWLAITLFVLLWPQAAGRLAASAAGAVFTSARAQQLREWLPLAPSEIVTHAAAWLVREAVAVLPLALGASLLMLAALHPALSRSLRRVVVVAAVAAAIAQLIVVHHNLNPFVDQRYFENRPPAAEGLRSAHPPLRIFAESLADMPDLPAVPLRVHLPEVSFLPPAAYEPYNERLSLQIGATLEGMETGYTPDVARTLPGPQHLLDSLVCEYRVRHEPLARLLRVSGMEYAFYRRMPPAEGLEWLATAPNASTTPVQVFRVQDPLPRVCVVPEANFLPVGLPTIHRLVAADFDPRREVVLDESQKALAGGRGPAETFSAEAKLLRRDALSVEVETHSSAPAYLVLTDSYDPQWQATIDGNVTPLLRANQIFRAVALPAGSHHVAFRYRPLPLYFGAAITLATALLLAIGVARDRS